MRIFFTVLFVFLSTVCLADQKAITDTGKEVILFDDGTWQYVNAADKEQAEIPVNKALFVKPEGSTFFLKSTRNNSGFWLNTKAWTFTKATNNPEAEYEFQLKNGDLWGMSLSEGIPIPVESLAGIALENAKSAAPDARIVKQEYRTVNGIKALYMEMKGTIQGIKFMYLGYYYSDDSGSTQFIVYTGSSLVKKYQKEIEDFLNGFSIQ